VITRRAALAGAAGTAALAAAAPVLGQVPRKPNVLFIMADDLGYADLSAYGRRDYATPHLDALAAQGMLFTHAYANSPVCTATRVALITGRYQYRLPIGLQEPLGQADVGLPPEHATLPSLLREGGYSTTLIGKWHLGSLPKYGPLQSGYDEFWGIRGGGVDYYSHEFNGRHDLWDGDSEIHRTGYLTELLADRAIQTLQRRADEPRPFFMSLHFTAPHWPWEAQDAAGQAESARLKARGVANAEMDYDGGSAATYAAMMKSLDDSVGRILAKLVELKMDGSTVVVFTSDNGGERFSDTGPFTGRKTEVLEGGIRVPAIVRWPGMIEAGSRSDTPVMSMDWLPTFMALAGASRSHASDGMDLRPVLAGGTLPERTLFWRFRNKDQKAARRGAYKYLSIGGSEFLFDVVADPMERANLKERDPRRFAELKAAFAAWDAGMLHDPAANSAGSSPATTADRFAPGV
jgi:arylsulfatase A-like enzyme